MFEKKRLTVQDFQSREDVEEIFLQILNPLKPFYSRHLPGCYRGWFPFGQVADRMRG